MIARRSTQGKRRPAMWLCVLLVGELFWVALSSHAAAARSVELKSTGPARAQPRLHQGAKFTHITTEQGLSDLRVLTIVQDHTGFIWFGTNNGLDRYDGYDVVAYRNDPANPHSLSGNLVEELYEDRDGTLWVGTRSGLNAFDHRTERFTRYWHDPANPRSLSDNTVVAIHEDRSGVLWIGTYGGLDRFDRATGTFTHYRHDEADPQSLGHDRVRVIYEDRSGVLWIGTYGGLDRFDRATGTFTHYRHDEADPRSLSHDVIWDIHEDRFGALWVGTDGGGLNRFDPASGTFTHYRHDPDNPNSLGSDRVDCIFEDDSGALWIGTFGGGLSELDAARRTFKLSQHDPANSASLSNDYVQDIIADRSGLIWFGTLASVNLYNPQGQLFTIYQHDPKLATSLASDNVSAIYEDQNGILWVGTQDSGLDRFDRRTGQIVHYPPDPTNPQRLGHPFVSAIRQDHTGALWVGTYGGGLYQLDPASGKFTAYRHDPANPQSLSDDTITTIHIDRSSALWVATRTGGLSRFDPASGNFTTYRHDPANPQSLSTDIIWSIAEDQHGNIWAGTLGGGLNCLNPATGHIARYQRDPNNPASLSDDNIYAIHIDRAGVLWVGTLGGGLSRFDASQGTFTHYRERDGMASDRIVFILEDSDGGERAAGNLWIATGRGLSKLDRDRKTFHSYGTTDGLPLTEYNRGRLMTRNGELLMSSVDGLIAFDPAAVRDDAYVPPIVFTDFRMANKPVPIGEDSPLKQAIDQSDTIQLTYADRVISFEFAALSYQASGQNRYRYMLEGFEQTWIEVDATRRLVTYTNLNPGTYTFRVTGSNGSGVWNEAGRAITLIVTPPWWATWWFRVLAIAMIVGCVLGSYAWRVTSFQRQRHALKVLVADRTRQLSRRTDELERAEAEARQSRDELATQLVVSQQIVATLDLDLLLNRILQELERIERFDAAGISIIEGDTVVIRAFRSNTITRNMLGTRYEIAGLHTFSKILATRQPLIVADRSADAEDLTLIEGATGNRDVIHAWMGTPLIAKDQVIGILSLVYHEVGYYDLRAQERVQLFANQAALAIENAQLYQAAQEAAVLEERHHIAHDLHDALTQTLFSASLIAEALRESSNVPSREHQSIEDLRQLTRGALAEMRALLYELHPSGQAERPLGQLLDSLCTAFTSRTRIPIALTVNGEHRLEPEVQKMLYRIAQEALNNIGKHAVANAVRVALACSPEEVVLVIADDGRGFEMSNGSAASAGMGMGSMRDRATRIGAQLRIESRPGDGTKVTVIWRAPVAQSTMQRH